MIQRLRRRLIRLFVGKVSTVEVYVTELIATPSGNPESDFRLRLLAAEDLMNLKVADAEMRARQIERLKRFGGSYAYAVDCDGEVAHISWLLPARAISRDVPQVLDAQPDDAEITGCETLPTFRGRGIYTFAIRSLIEVARKQGARRVFMKTSPDNKVSQAGIRKAGLSYVGSVSVVMLPLVKRRLVMRRYG